MAPIEAVARRVPGLPVIEDAAQSIGARRMIDGEWRMAGEVATIGTFSFFPSKNLGGYGDGGMIVTQDDALADAAAAAARARRRQAVLPRRGRATTAGSMRCRRRCCRPSCRISRRGARSAARTRRTTTRRSPISRTCARPYVDPENESIFNQYTIRVAAPRRAAGVSQGAGHRQRRSTIRCRCTCSRASPTSATRKGSARRASARRARCCRCRSSPSSVDAAARRSRRGGSRLLRTLSTDCQRRPRSRTTLSSCDVVASRHHLHSVLP